METIKKYAKAIPYVLVVGLIIALCVTQCSKQKVVLENHESELKAAINQKEKQLVTIQNREQAQRSQWHKDSLEMKASENRFKQVANKATKERDQARAKIQYLYDSIPEVKEFVDADSVSDQINLDRIREMGLEKISIVKSFSDMLSLKDDEIKLTHDLNDYYKTENDRLLKQFKKEKNWKTFWQLAFGIVTTALVAQSLDVF